MPPSSDDTGLLPSLPITDVASYLPTARHHAWMCSSGSRGYGAFKEMLQNGLPGYTILLETRDVRSVDMSNYENSCSTIYSYARIRSKPNLSWFFITQRKRYFIPPSMAIFTNMKRLPIDFLSGCAHVTAVDLSPLSHHTELPSGFLAGCSGLTTLDLSPLSNLRVLPNDFLIECSGLTSLDLTPLAHLETGLPPSDHPAGFLSGCSGLKTIDLRLFARSSWLPWGFLRRCSGLETLDLSPLSLLTEIPAHFLEGCSNLKSIDLRPLSKLEELPCGFLSGCCGLTSLDLSPLSHLAKLPDHFLVGCRSLAVVDISMFTNLEKLPMGFLLVRDVTFISTAPDGFIPSEHSTSRRPPRSCEGDDSPPIVTVTLPPQLCLR